MSNFEDDLFVAEIVTAMEAADHQTPRRWLTLPVAILAMLAAVVATVVLLWLAT